jgi:starvation-inducible outer membrane lipoprotein
MKTRVLLLVTALTLLAGCASYPLNMTKSQWDALTPGQQADAERGQHNKEASEARQARDDAATRNSTASSAAEADGRSRERSDSN